MEKKIIINIGRQFGGGGRGVAYELGKKLNIPVKANFEAQLSLKNMLSPQKTPPT